MKEVEKTWEGGNGVWHLKKSIFIDRRIEEVHQYTTDPRYWYQWYAGLSEPENMIGTGKKGTSMDMKFSMLGKEVPIHVLVEENAMRGDGYIWRGSISGAISAEQTWLYIPNGEGADVTLEMDYELPGILLARVANRLYIKKLMENSLEQTLQNLKDISESE
jgi:hypothetical protein